MSASSQDAIGEPRPQAMQPPDRMHECKHCPVAKYGIYRRTLKSSPDRIVNLRTGVSSYEPNRTILRQGESSSVFGSLRTGWAYPYTTLEDGSRHIQGFLIPGDTIAIDLLYIGSHPLSFGVKALTRASVCWFPVSGMRELLHRTEAQAREAETWMAYYFAALNHRASTISQGDAKAKIAEFLLEIVGRLRFRGLTRGDGFEFQPTQSQIGDCLGLTSVSVSKIVGDFQRRKLLEIREKVIRVFDEKALRAIAEGDD